MTLPDTSSLLEVQRRYLVIAIRLGLLQITLLEELFDEEEEHTWVPREEVLYFVQRHVLGMTWRLEGPLYEVIRAGN